MTSVVSTILNYYGIVHLLYYGGQQFLSKPAPPSSPTWGSKAAKATVVADKAKEDSLEDSEMANPELYLWLSKWIIFITYVYTEPFLLALLDIVPGISVLSMVFKLKVLSTNNTWHQVVYERTYAHLKDFDILEVLWQFSSNRVLSAVCYTLRLTSLLYPKLTVDQLEKLGQDLDEIRSELESHKRKNSHRETVRASRMLHKSQLDAGLLAGGASAKKENASSTEKQEDPFNRKRSAEELTPTKTKAKRDVSANKKDK